MKKNMSKTLFLWIDKSDFYPTQAKKRGISIAQVYKNLNIVQKVIRRLQIKFDLPGIAIWLDNWKFKTNNYDTIIIHASNLTPAVVKYIRSKNKTIRIIVWYWNPVDKCVDVNTFKRLDCEIWSFDEKDCATYNLKHNTQYYFNNIQLAENNIEFDVYFLGKNKGRATSLTKLEQEIKQLKLNTFFHITELDNKRDRKNRISYEENLSNISKSKAILDYVSDNQSGLTLRPLEALFFNKKLITNDKSIKNRDFYHPNNIFILEDDDFSNLKEFLKQPNKEMKHSIVKRYEFDSWFARFFEH